MFNITLSWIATSAHQLQTDQLGKLMLVNIKNVQNSDNGVVYMEVTDAVL